MLNLALINEGAWEPQKIKIWTKFAVSCPALISVRFGMEKNSILLAVVCQISPRLMKEGGHESLQILQNLSSLRFLEAQTSHGARIQIKFDAEETPPEETPYVHYLIS